MQSIVKKAGFEANLTNISARKYLVGTCRKAGVPDGTTIKELFSDLSFSLFHCIQRIKYKLLSKFVSQTYTQMHPEIGIQYVSLNRFLATSVLKV